MLPFDSLNSESVEFPEVGTLPKYGCLTLNEHLALDALIADTGDLLSSPLGMVLGAGHLNAILASVLLLSRLGQEWTLERVQGLKVETVGAIAQFVLGERSRWQPPRQQTAAPKGRAIDWGEVFWRLQAAYPSEPRFSQAQFGNVPMVVIEGALAALNERELQAAHTAAVPVALAATYVLQSKGVKKVELDWFDPYMVELKRREARAEIPQAAARVFLRLCRENKVPSWVVATVDVEAIRWAAE